MKDSFMRYMQGLKHLKAYLKDSEVVFRQIELLELRLDREISATQSYGDKTRSAEINAILEQVI